MSQKTIDEVALFAASVTGLTIVVTPGTKWRLENETLFIGEDYYSNFHMFTRSGQLLSAMLLLDIWTVYRLPKNSFERMLKRRSLEAKQDLAAQQDLVPLLKTIDRLEAVSGLLAAFPNFREDVGRVFRALVPKSFKELSLSQQLIVLLLLAGVGEHENVVAARNEEVSKEVIEELTKITAGENLLQVVLHDNKPAGKIAAGKKQFERLFALLAPSYLHLLEIEQQKQEKGLTTIGMDEADAEESLSVDFGSAAGEESGDQDETNASESDDQEDERESTETEIAEGADLFEASGAAQVMSLLDTPIETNSPQMLEMMQEFEETDNKNSSDFGVEEALGDVRQTNYQARVRSLSQQIDKMLEVWRGFISPRDSPQTKLSKQLDPAGEMLDESQFARIIAETQAGVQRPAAFKYRERHPRWRRNINSVDYILIVDRSSSMQAVSAAVADAALILMESLASFMREVKEINFEEGDTGLEVRTALIAFDTTAEVVKPLSSGIDDKARFALYTKSESPQGSTHDAAAFCEAAKELGVSRGTLSGAGSTVSAGSTVGTVYGNAGEKKRKRVIIMISDGHSSDEAAAAEEINFLKSKGVEIWGIGVRDDAMQSRYAPFCERVERGSEISFALKKIIETASRSNS